jgi:Tfp pilus assembly protein PilV
MADHATPSPARGGFSIIEVLGAVSILGITYVMLATLAIQGMQLTGESQRRLRASLIADEVLNEYELASALGQGIATEEREEVIDEFTVRLAYLSRWA